MSIPTRWRGLAVLAALVAGCSSDPETFTAPIYYCADPQSPRCSAAVEGAEHWLDIEFERAAPSDVEGPLCRAILRGRIGNDLSVVIARDRDRRSTALAGNQAAVRVASSGAVAELSCVPEGDDVYVKACRYRAGAGWAQFWSELDACTATYRVHLPDPSNEVARPTLTPQVLADHITCVVTPMLDVGVCFSWDDRTLIVNNSSDLPVHLKLNVEKRWAGPLDLDAILAKLRGLVSIESLEPGDVVRAEAWVYDPARSDAADSPAVPDFAAEFVLSDEPLIKLDEAAIRRKFRVTAPLVRGVGCTFVGQRQGAEAPYASVPEVTRFRCLNQTGTSAVMSLYALAPSGDGYVVDHFAGDMYAGDGEVDEEVLDSVLLDDAPYLLTHRDAWSWSATTDGGVLFTTNFYRNTAIALDAGLLLEPLP